MIDLASVENSGTLDVAVASALRDARADGRPGAVVLLSPACASFDMFTSYAHRAQVFVDAVRELGLDKGEVIA